MTAFHVYVVITQLDTYILYQSNSVTIICYLYSLTSAAPQMKLSSSVPSTVQTVCEVPLHGTTCYWPSNKPSLDESSSYLTVQDEVSCHSIPTDYESLLLP